jgi:hypothetical protein
LNAQAHADHPDRQTFGIDPAAQQNIVDRRRAGDAADRRNLNLKIFEAQNNIPKIFGRDRRAASPYVGFYNCYTIEPHEWRLPALANKFMRADGPRLVLPGPSLRSDVP